MHTVELYVHKLILRTYDSTYTDYDCTDYVT